VFRSLACPDIRVRYYCSLFSQSSGDLFGSLGERQSRSGASIVMNLVLRCVKERTQNLSKILAPLRIAGNNHSRLWAVHRDHKDGLGQRVSPLMSPFARAKPKVRPEMRDVMQTQIGSVLPPQRRFPVRPSPAGQEWIPHYQELSKYPSGVGISVGS